MDRSRLEAFSDGVFAVAITLLAFYIAVKGPDYKKADLIHQLSQLEPAFFGYLVSFFTIGIIWVNHHALVRNIVAVDRTLLFLNLVLLLFVVLIPFATNTVADYGLSDSFDGRVSVAVYSTVFFGMSLGFGSVFEWTLHGERTQQPLPAERHWQARIRFVGGALVYLVGIGVAMLNSVAGFALIAAVAVYYILERTPAPTPGEKVTPANEE